MTPEFDKFCEGLWDNINKAKKKGKVSSKWKNDPKYRKQMKKQAAKISKEGIDDPVRPGILKRQVSGKVTCSKARSLKSKQKNKGNNTAKAAQRFINYHCDSVENEAARCTKTTKKASSTSKGKKWMKCVKNPDGKGYKRIHWGQKGVKVSGKANTKRRKSFRARHKCSTAKPGTPKYQACKDW